jgi:hypothetical protein
MAHRLNTRVYVDGSWYGPDVDVPAEVADLITNPDVWAEGGPTEPKAEAPAAKVKEPPRGGPGSSADAWRSFMVAQGYEVPDDASAKDMQSAWDARNEG